MVVLIITHSHTCHDAAGGGQEFFVGDFQHHVPAGVVVIVGKAENLHLEDFHAVPADVAEDPGGAQGGFPGGKHLAPEGGAGAEDAETAVSVQAAQGFQTFHRALQLSRVPGFALADGGDGGGIDVPAEHGGQIPRGTADPMAQGTEGSAVRVIVGDGADAGDALPDIDPQLGALVRYRRIPGQVQFLAFPGHRETNGAVGLGQGLLEVLGRVHGLTVQ